MATELNNGFDSTEEINDDSGAPNPFDVLPYEMFSEIFSKLEAKKRQQLRKVCNLWKFVIDNFHGIHLVITNMNWNWVENCIYAKSAKLCGFSRDVLNPENLASRLVSLEITDFIAYYSLMPLLEECNMLESLFINCVCFLPKSRLLEYTSSEYLDREGKQSWLPRLTNFKFVSVTTQTGVYNHIIPNDLPVELQGLEEAIQTFDVSRGEMEFVPLIIRILTHAKSLSNVEMVLTDIWKIPFADLLQVNIDAPPVALDMSLWHFGSKRLLPVGVLLQKSISLSSMKFTFPHHLNTFYMKFKPLSYQQLVTRNEPYQLEEVVVQQSLRWSQDMQDVDIPWLQILEKQCSLKRVEYPFPLSGDDQRMAGVISQNCKTLQSIIFIGHRENLRDRDPDWPAVAVGGRGRVPWDSEWFSECDKLEELHLKCHTRFLGPTSMTSLIKTNLLPHYLKHFVFHGCLDTGSSTLCVALCSLMNLQSFTHQARLCPWYNICGVSIFELDISHVKAVLLSMPQLKSWKMEWCDSSSAILTHFTQQSQLQRQPIGVAFEVLEWLKTMKDSIEYQYTNVDRQMKGLTINPLCDK